MPINSNKTFPIPRGSAINSNVDYQTAAMKAEEAAAWKAAQEAATDAKRPRPTPMPGPPRPMPPIITSPGAQREIVAPSGIRMRKQLNYS